jgi:hypothetical protein
MLRVTWEWLGQEPALDLANTVAVVNGVDRDLLAPAGAYDRWAAAEGTAPDSHQRTSPGSWRPNPRCFGSGTSSGTCWPPARRTTPPRPWLRSRS